ncbi:MAG TPA: T9SS type A sorting domain-containing protein [Chitinophagales bacterium]|nr:T9SS type A sorting domain-containing protein [Chitinophagales bacterium]
MERLDFLKKGVGFLGMAIIGPSMLGANKAAACTTANSETAGPFPTITPASLVRSNIIGTRTGVPFTINITVKNINDSCNPAQGLIVDIWHCDKDGYYSEYGGTSMQQVDYTSQDFLRGRQTSDSAGLVSFTSIFPGWYSGRATHIHVHVYDSNGNSLAITQIAFPEASDSAVVTVNSATSFGYAKGMSGYTYNAADNVFSDGASTEMSTISGDLNNGYVLSWDCYVSAPVTTTTNIETLPAESQFQIRQNFPNPCTSLTKIPVVLRTPSEVKVSIITTDGREVYRQIAGNLNSGEQMIDLDVSKLATGKYIFTVKVSNLNGAFSQSKLFVKM